MALIACPDCTREVSSVAPACPNCGRPIAASNSAGSEAALTTIQATSKKLKLHGAVSVTTMVAGILWMFLVFGSPGYPQDKSGLGWAFLVFFAGLAHYVITRIRIWWHHE